MGAQSLHTPSLPQLVRLQTGRLAILQVYDPLALEPGRSPSQGQPIKLVSLALCLEGAAVWRVTDTLLFDRGRTKHLAQVQVGGAMPKTLNTAGTQYVLLEFRLFQEAFEISFSAP